MSKRNIDCTNNSNNRQPLIGVLAIQGAFEEHQKCLEASGCRTKQVCFLFIKNPASEKEIHSLFIFFFLTFIENR